MNHRIVLLIGAVCTIFASISPAGADDPKTTRVQAKSAVSLLITFPKAIAGFFAGVAVGTQICFVRKLPQEVSTGAHGFVGSVVKDDNNKFFLVPACALWLPCAAFITTLEAPAYALKDAYRAEKPFSKEQFSLGELDP